MIAARLASFGVSNADMTAISTRPALARMIDSLHYGLQVLNAAECASLPAARAHEMLSTVKPVAGLSWTGIDLSTAEHYLRQPGLNASLALRAVLEVEEGPSWCRKSV